MNPERIWSWRMVSPGLLVLGTAIAVACTQKTIADPTSEGIELVDINVPFERAITGGTGQFRLGVYGRRHSGSYLVDPCRCRQIDVGGVERIDCQIMNPRHTRELVSQRRPCRSGIRGLMHLAVGDDVEHVVFFWVFPEVRRQPGPR